MMLQIFETLWADSLHIGNMSDLLSRVEHVLELIGEDYIQDKNMRNAAIDAVVQILQGQKDK